MKPIVKEQTEFDVTLTRDEVEMIRGLTQNYLVEDRPEDPTVTKVRLGLFVGASRLLGYEMDDTGNIKRGSKLFL